MPDINIDVDTLTLDGTIYLYDGEGVENYLDDLQELYPGRASDCQGVRIYGKAGNDTIWINAAGVEQLTADFIRTVNRA